MSDVSLKLSAKDIYEKDFEKLWLVAIEEKKLFRRYYYRLSKMADMNNEVVKLSEENNKLKRT